MKLWQSRVGDRLVTLSEARRVMPLPIGNDNLVKTRFDTDDIINLIQKVDSINRSKKRTSKLAEILRGGTDTETLKNIYYFIQNNIQYIADANGNERVKEDTAVIFEGFSDCKGYSLLTGSLLNILGIPYKYRFARYVIFPKNVTHVYTVAFADGREWILDAVNKEGFNKEVAYKYAIDLPISNNYPTIGLIEPTKNNWFKDVLIAFGVAIILKKLF